MMAYTSGNGPLPKKRRVPHVSLSDLPEGTLLRVFSLVSPTRDLPRLRQVCQKWSRLGREVVDSVSILSRPMHGPYFRNFPNIKSLTVDANLLEEVFTEELALKCLSLTTMTVTGVMGPLDGLMDVISKCKSLRQIHISHWRSSINLIGLLENGCKLKSLAFSPTRFTAHEPEVHMYQHALGSTSGKQTSRETCDVSQRLVGVTCVPQVCPTKNKMSSSTCWPSMVHLCVSDTDFTNDGLILVGKACPSLKFLEIAKLPLITLEGIQLVVKVCPLLYLDVRESTSQSQHLVQTISSSSLSSLVVEAYRDVVRGSLVGIHTRLPNLTCLDFGSSDFEEFNSLGHSDESEMPTLARFGLSERDRVQTLRSVKFYDTPSIKPYVLGTLLTLWPQLTHFSARTYTSLGHLQVLAAACPQLMYLETVDGWCWPQTAYFPELNYLHLKSEELDVVNLAGIAKLCPKVTTLKLSCRIVTGSCYMANFAGKDLAQDRGLRSALRGELVTYFKALDALIVSSFEDTKVNVGATSLLDC